MSIDIERLATDAAYWDELAPDGATRYDERYVHPWRRSEEGCELYFSAALQNWVSTSRTDSEGIPRPQAPAAEWVDGLPPAGSQCECYHASLGGKKQWIVCDVVGPYGDYVICAPNGGGFYGFDAHELRPIRTPEQRQRDELIGKIASLNAKGCCICDEDAGDLADAILSQYNLEPKP